MKIFPKAISKEFSSIERASASTVSRSHFVAFEAVITNLISNLAEKGAKARIEQNRRIFFSLLLSVLAFSVLKLMKTDFLVLVVENRIFSPQREHPLVERAGHVERQLLFKGRCGSVKVGVVITAENKANSETGREYPLHDKHSRSPLSRNVGRLAQPTERLKDSTGVFSPSFLCFSLT